MKKKREKHQGMSIREIAKRGLAVVLASAMLLSNNAMNLSYVFASESSESISDIATSETEPTPAVLENAIVEREPQDLTERQEELQLSLQKAQATVTDVTDPITIRPSADNSSLDLSGLAPDKLENLTLDVGIEFLKEAGMRDLKAGDSWTITIPSEYLTLTDQGQPQELHTIDKVSYQLDGTKTPEGLLLATYTILQNRITFTLENAVDFQTVSALFAILSLPVSIRKDQLSSDEQKTISLTMQQGHALSILLPKLPAAELIPVEPIPVEPIPVEPTPTEAVPTEAVPTETAPTEAAEVTTPETVPTESVTTAPTEETPDKDSKPTMSDTAGAFEDAAVLAEKDQTTTSYVIKDGKAAGAAEGSTVDAFNRVRMRFTSLADGYDDSYSLSKQEKKVEFSMETKLDDSYLGAAWDQYFANAVYDKKPIADMLEAAMNADAADKKKAYASLETAMESITAVHPPVYQYNYGKNFVLPEDQLNTSIDVKATIDGTEMSIGSYVYTKDKDGNLIVTFTYHLIVYAISNVTASFSAGLYFDDVLFEDSDHVDVNWDGDQLVLEVNGRLDKKEKPLKDDDYTASKEAVYHNNLYIDYIIKFGQAANHDAVLDKAVCVDDLPAGLTVESVKLALNGKMPNVLAKSAKEGENAADTYQLVENADGTYSFKYEFPDAKPDTTSAEFTVRAVLTPDEYQKYMDSGDRSYTATFNNTASLKGPGEKELYKNTQETTTNMKATFFSKDGSQNPFNGNIFDWQIDVNTYFSDGVNTYIIDQIDASKNTLLPDSLKITKDGEDVSIPVENIDTMSEILDTYYDAYTSAALKQDNSSLQALLAQATNSGEKAVYYTGNDNYQYIIIPFDPLINGKVQINYSTHLTDGFTTNEKADLTNKVKMIWKHFTSGIGPGKDFEWNIDIGKNVVGTYSYVQKNAADFDAAAHTQGWDFKINQYRQNIKSLVVTEQLGAQGMRAADQDTWTYSYYKDGVLITENQTITSDPGATPYYEAATEGETGNQIVKFYFGDLAPEDYYELHIKTDVTDQLASGSGADANQQTLLKNKATFTYEGSTGTDPVEAVGEKSVPDILIKKDVVKDYNAVDHTIQWEVTINSDDLPLTDAILTDELPEGNVFKSLDRVTRNGVEGTIAEDQDFVSFADTTIGITCTDESGVSETGASKNKKIFTFTNQKQDKSSYTFTFTTKMGTTAADQVYLNNLISKNEAVPIQNIADLAGKIGDETITDSAHPERKYVSDSASTPVADKALGKSGMYNSEAYTDSEKVFHDAGTVTWTVVLNKGQVDMTGKEIRESFTSNQLLEMYIPENSSIPAVHVYTADMDGSQVGTRMDVTDTVQEAFHDSVNYHGFVFTVPEILKGKVLIFTYDTYITDDAASTEITNTVGLYEPGNDNLLQEVTSGSDGLDEFWLDDVASGQINPYLKVYKVSQSINETALNTLKLSGADFEVTAYDYDTEKAGYVKSERKAKDKTSQDSGRCIFMNMRRNVLYKITEVKAPDGYEKSDVVHYVLFSSDQTPDTITNSVPIFESKDASATDVKNLTDVVSASKKTFNYTLTDVPSSSFSFTKYGEDGTTPLSDVTFQLVRTTDNKVVAKEATSDAAGVVTFEKVDPGDYEIQEVYVEKDSATAPATPYGYQCLEGTLLSVHVGADGAVTFTPVDTAHAKVSETGEASVTNRLLRGNVKLTKQDQNGTALVGVQFNLTSNDAADPADYSRTGLTTNALGELKIEGLSCGTYTLTEDINQGYVAGKVKEPVTVKFTVERRGESGTAVTVKNVDSNELSKVTEDNKTFYLPGKDGVVTNTLKYGRINLTKQSRDINDDRKAVPNVSFTIYAGTDTEAVPFLTLMTDEKGQFAPNGDGSYTDADGKTKKWLVYGNYTIKETKAITDHQAKETSYEFIISDEKTGAPNADSNKSTGAAWLTDAGIQYRQDATPPDNAAFTNNVVRGSVTLTKKDDFNNFVNGAKFVLSTASDKTKTDAYVGSFLQSGSTGPYVLSPSKYDSTSSYSAQKQYSDYGSFSLPYLQKASNNAEYKLLPGTYYIFEMETPDHYAAPATYGKKVVVNADGTTVYYDYNDNTASSLQDQITNTVSKTSLTITKRDTFSQNKIAGDLISGITFKLQAVSLAVTGTSFTEVEEATKTDGTVTFENLYPGTYTLTEEDHKGYLDSTPSTYTLEVTCTSANQNQPEVQITPKDGTQTALTAVKGVFYYDITNTPYTGTISLEKKDSDDRLLKGVAFTLYRVITTGAAKTTEVKIQAKTTDDEGKINFTNLPYGNYKLVEDGTGVTDPKTIVISKTDTSEDATKVFVLKDTDHTFTYDVGTITNTLASRKIQFTKLDQNDDAVDGMEFSVYRQTSYGENVKDRFDLTNTTGTYQPYYANTTADQMTVTTNKGVADLGDLPIGNYKLTETHKANIQDSMDVTILLQVTEKGVKWKSYYGDTESGTLLDAVYSEADKNDTFTVYNQMKYGFIQINKVAGEENASTIKNTAPVANAEFVIYKKGSNEAYLTLKTDADGHFPAAETNGENKGAYKDAADATGNTYKYLIYGDYTIKETANADYDLSDLQKTTGIAFKIDESTTKQEGTALIEYDASKDQSSVTYVEKGTTVSTEITYANKIVRSGLSVKKVDYDHQDVVLSDAQFMIYAGTSTNKKYVAKLGYDAATGTYRILSAVDEGTYQTTEKNDNGVAYLYDGKLLQGTYFLEETKAPAGYEGIAAIQFKMDGNGLAEITANTTLTNQKDAASLANAVLTVRNIKIENKVILTKFEKDAATGQNTTTKVVGAKYTLYQMSGKTPAPETDPKIAENLTTGSDGIITYPVNAAAGTSLLAEGAYYFLETSAPENYAVDPTPVKVTIGEGDGQYVKPDGMSVTASNQLLNAKLAFTKYDRIDGTSTINGAKFEMAVYADAAKTVKLHTFEIVTDRDGKATLSKYDGTAASGEIMLTKGYYTLKEVASTITNAYEAAGNGVTPELTFEVTDACADQTLVIKKSAIDGNPFSLATSDSGKQENYLQSQDASKAEGIYDDRTLGSITLFKGEKENNNTGINNAKFVLEKQKVAETIWDQIGEFFTGKTYTSVAATESTDPATGILTIKNLEWGTYRIKEIKAADGYVLGDSTYREVVIGKDNILNAELTYNLGTITNAQTDIVITKTTDDGATKLSGAELVLTGKFADDATKITSKSWISADDQGEEFKKLLIVGETYMLTEKNRVTGYAPFTESVSIKMTENGGLEAVTNPKLADGQQAASVTAGPDGAAVVLRNVKILGAAQITKTDSADAAKKLSNVSFDVYKVGATAADDQKVDMVTTDASGIATTKDLPEGTYYFIETGTQDGYVLDTAAKTEFTIGANDYGAVKKVTATNEKLHYNVKLTKMDTSNNALLAGAGFTLYEKDDTAKDGWKAVGPQIQSDADGRVTFTIQKKGTYKVKETETPANFVTSAYDSGEFTVDNSTAYQNQTKNLGTVTNTRKTGSVKLTKKDSVTKEVLSGAEFTITDVKGAIVGTAKSTNKEGEVEFTGLYFGNTYTITETKAPTGYVLPKGNDAGKSFTLSNAQTSIDFGSWMNTPKTGTIILTKKDADHATRFLSGVKFELYRGKTLVQEAVSNKHGIVTFTEIPYGTYTIKEIPQDGIVSASASQEIPIEKSDAAYEIGTDGFTYAKEVTNTLVQGSITLTKQNQNGDTLSGITFSLYRRQESADNFAIHVPSSQTNYVLFENYQATTDGDGTLTMSDIPYGDYKLVETTTAQLHQGEKPAEVVFTIDKDGNTTNKNTVVTNICQYGFIDLTKTFDHAAKTGRPSAAFAIYKDAAAGDAFDAVNDTLYMMVRTDADGKLIRNSKNGAYKDFTTNTDGTDKWLLTGNYYIKELSYEGDPYYDLDTTIYAMTITDGKAATIGTNGTVNNAAIRGSVALTKSGQHLTGEGDNVTVETLVTNLKGAEFAVCLKDTKNMVAMLKNVSGNTYTLQSAAEITNFFKKLTNAFGVSYLDGELKLLAGTYDIYEVITPLGYVHPTDKVAAMTITKVGTTTDTNGGNDNITNTIHKQDIEVQKLVELADDTALNVVHTPKTSADQAGGFTFKLTRIAEADGSQSTFTYEKEVTTAADGTATYADVPSGTYKVVETAAPSNYQRNAAEQTIIVDRDGNVSYGKAADGVTEKTALEFSDNLKRGSILGTKIDRASTEKAALGVAGAAIGLYKDSGCAGDPLLSTVTRGTDGAYTFTNLPYGTYYLKETAAPDGYQLNTTDIKTVVVAETVEHPAAEVTAEAIENTMYLGSLKLDKTDSITGEKLTGAEFTLTGTTVYQETFSQKAATTDARGNYQLVQFTKLPLGTYTVEETTIPDGYQKADHLTVTVSGTKGGVRVAVAGTVVAETDAYTVQEVINKGTISFTKYGTDSENDLNSVSALAGAQFTLYTDAACTQKASVEADLTKNNIAVSAEDGTVTFEAVRPGTYYIRETHAPKNYSVDENIYRGVIHADGTWDGIYDGTAKTDRVTDEAVRGSIQLTKTDSRDGTKLSNVTFTLYRDGQAIQTAVTDTKGVAGFENLLMDVTYTVKETATRNNYVLSGVEQQVTLHDTATQRNADLGSWTNTPTSFSFKKVQTTGAALKGAVFGLYDGTTQITTAVSDADGIVAFAYLEKGKTYTVKEESAPEGYFVNPATFQLEVDADGSGTLKNADETVTEVVNADKGSITIQKKDAVNRKALAGAVFELKDETDTVIDSQTSDTDGKLVFSELPMGTYTIVEKSAPTGYLLSSDATTVILTKGAATQNISKELLNRKADFSFKKVVKYLESCYQPDAVKVLAGAEFTLSREGDNKTFSAVSDKDGIVSFTAVDTGTWQLQETKVPQTDQVLLDYTVHKVVIDAAGAVTIDNQPAADTTIENDVARTAIKLIKVDEQHPDKVLKNSVYGLYRKSGSSAAARRKTAKAEGEILIASAKTDADGILRFEGVLTQVTYVIRELEAPDGSYVSEKPISMTFQAAEDGTVRLDPESFDGGDGTASVDPITGVITWYEPPTMAKLYKKDTDGKLLAGATLRITNEDGTTVEGLKDWVSSSEDGHLISGILVQGKTYLLTELKAPDGYEPANPVKFTMSDKKVGPNENFIQEIEMIDQKTPITTTAPMKTPSKTPTITTTPKTTPEASSASAAKTMDDTPIVWLLILILLSGTGVVLLRKQKHQEHLK
ncbi:MAG: SpaA isopeptide-forming pilin-related protein [Lachnospiraceae bacterium]|nr:SpaA isopeptide-forming pilin-related protein [Lachnospiraceae bacterium]